ncbi:PAS domain S-box-containing protein [Natronoarchaeum philippinense]|uniref:PAS domain S-box-containing protein n=1 Tax=Natronoarchaeum philippinense TaxID=558529 RepID=A0A285P6P6_NATPI|nr:PAS domain-containing protein [Natronoarchaeum philippinense]SNZ17429.1 PAS domain S-box-containing protein [Natronoarchaeum philippinense]
MNEHITVLHVDDEPPQLDLTKTFLEREGDLDVRSESDPEQALAALDGSIDCVLSDYQMPEMDGIEFLDAVRERRPSVPFVLFTGKGSEEIASEAISAGVSDYIQKETGTDQYAVLANRIRNLVDRRRTERTLRQRVEAIEAASEGIAVFEAGGELSYANTAFGELYGYDAADLEGSSWHKIAPEWALGRVESEVRPALRSDGEWSGEVTCERADGETFPTTISLARIDDAPAAAPDASAGAVCVVRDLTEQRERECELEEQRRRFRSLLESLPGMAYRARTDSGWPIEFASEGCERLTGYSPEEFESGEVSWGEAVLHPEDAETINRVTREALANGDAFALEYRIVRKDGDVRWVYERGHRVEPGILEGYITDVTARRRLEADLRRARGESASEQDATGETDAVGEAVPDNGETDAVGEAVPDDY